MNRYAYAGNDPINRSDLSGRSLFDFFGGVADVFDLLTTSDFNAAVGGILTGAAVFTTCAVGVELVTGGAGSVEAGYGCTALGFATNEGVQSLIRSQN
jgi:hypothetical protein